MQVLGRFPAQRLVNQVVFRRAGEVFRAARHQRNGHQMVVHHIGKVVGRQTVRLNEDDIVQRGAIHVQPAIEQIVESCRALRGHVEADDIRHARGKLGLALLAREVQAMLIVLEGFAALRGLLPAFIQLLARTKAIIGVPGFHQLLRIGQVQILALGLNIRPIIAANVRPLVVVQSRRREAGINLFHRAGHLALLVGILDAQNKRAMVAAREQVGIKRGAQAAQVQIPRGAGRKSRAKCHMIRSFVHFDTNSIPVAG